VNRTRASLQPVEDDGEDELSPNVTRESTGLASSPSKRARREEGDVAEEIDDNEAAKRLGRKRPRHSIRPPSPEVEDYTEEGDAPEEPTQEDGQIDEPEPTRKRRRKHASRSPAQQKQPSKKPKPAPQPKRPNGRRKKDKEAAVRDEEEHEAVQVTVQRFTKQRPSLQAEDDSDTDILNTDIPFASRSGVNPVDVFAQACEEVIEQSLERLEAAVEAADDRPAKKELRVKMRALEAFREEISTRLLQHVSFEGAAVFFILSRD
jgi:hypothetical protein